MRSSVFLCIFAALLGQVQAGNFVGGRVRVTYNVYTVIEGERFSMKCTAEHEDGPPDLMWYSINVRSDRKNFTEFDQKNRGNVATSTFFIDRASPSDSGDYFCSAKGGTNNEQQKTSVGIPILVIKEENRPRVRITMKRHRGKHVLTCSVYPQGSGLLTWRHEGRRLNAKKLSSELELETTLSGEFQCHGNLTLGGYKHFISRAYATATAGWSYTTQNTFLSLLLVCFIAFLNL